MALPDTQNRSHFDSNDWREDTVDELNAAWENSTWELRWTAVKLIYLVSSMKLKNLKRARLGVFGVSVLKAQPPETFGAVDLRHRGKHIEESWNFSVASTAFDE